MARMHSLDALWQSAVPEQARFWQMFDQSYVCRGVFGYVFQIITGCRFINIQYVSCLPQTAAGIQ